MTARAEGIGPETVIGPLYMGPTGDGRETLTVDVLISCTPVEARWCPLCGRCTCADSPLDRDRRGAPMSLDHPLCPLHAPGSDHA